MKQLFIALALVAGSTAAAQVSVSKNAQPDTSTAGKVSMPGLSVNGRVIDHGVNQSFEIKKYEVEYTDNEKGITVIYKGGYRDRLYAIMETDSRKLLAPFVFERFNYSFRGNENEAEVMVNGKWGIVDARGKVLMPCIYSYLEKQKIMLNNQVCYIARLDDRYGIVTDSNRVLLPFDYSYINVQEDYINVCKDGKCALLGRNLKPLVKEWYNSLTMRYGFGVAQLGGKYGLIGYKGEVLVPFVYEMLEVLVEHDDEEFYFIARKNGKYGLLKLNGNAVIPFEYDSLGQFSPYSRFFIAVKNKLRGVVDKKGKLLLPVEYNEIAHIHANKTFMLRKGNKYGIINSDMKILLPVAYDHFEPIVVNGSGLSTYFLIKQHGKAGICDKDGKWVLDAIYDELKPDIKPDYTILVSFQTPFVVAKNGSFGMVAAKADSAGGSHTIVPFEYEDLERVNGTLIIARKKGKYGVRTIKDATVVLPFEYQTLTYKSGALVGYKDGFEKFKVKDSNITPAIDF